MKERFHGYYRPTDEEFELLWRDAVIALDANVLLNQYSYSCETREEFLQLLSEMGERVWLPYQAAAEYHQNRCRIILEEAKRYSKIIDNLRSTTAELQTAKHHPFIEASLLEQFKGLSSEIEKSLTQGADSHRSLLRDDSIRDMLTDIFAGRTGEPFSDEEKDVIYAEGEARYANKVPPGYEDGEKQRPEKFGDLVIWKEIISISLKTDKGVIFVTDDAKRDWWLIEGAERIGPRPELLLEFREATGNNIYIYSSHQFAKYAKEHGKRVSDQAYAELEAANSAREHNELEQRLVTSTSIAEHESQQGELDERLRGSFSGYEAYQRKLDQRLRGPLGLARLEAQRRKLDERLRGSLSGHEAYQRKLDQLLKGKVSLHEAYRRKLDERLKGNLSPREAYRRKFDERLRGSLARIQSPQPDVNRATSDLSDVTKAGVYDVKKPIAEESGYDDLGVERDSGNHPVTNDD
jgi:hypothetical protein